MIRFILVVVSCCIFSCAGPSKTGQEARKKAHARMDLVNADLASQQARQQFEVGQLDAALTTINVAILRFPNKSDYHQLRGRILLEQHRLDEARLALEFAAALKPEAAEPHYLLGVLHQRWSDDKAALDSYTVACNNNPLHAQFFIAKAETLVALDRHDEAIALLTGEHNFQHQAAVPALLGQIYLLAGNPEKATMFLSDSRSLGNDAPFLFADLAMAEFQAGLYAECLMTLRELEITSKDGLTTLQRRIRGKCLVATGSVIQGRDICLRITRETPQDADAWIDLGFIAWKMGDYRRLKTAGEHISRLAPSRWEGPLFVGKAALETNNDELAAKSFTIVSSLSENEELSSWISSVLERVNGKSEKVLEDQQNMPANHVEVGLEEPIPGLDGSEPLVNVPQNVSQDP